MRIRLHYNRQSSKSGLPWTLHTSKACHHAAHVKFLVPVETEERPEKLKNPRYFMKCNGRIVWEGKSVVISPA